MKKSPKKLALHRETLRHLDENGLEKVRGGFRTETCNYDCEGYTINTCHNSCNSTPMSDAFTCTNYTLNYC
ncbi:MAG TPA: class I lanthipeptide [Thermoanaerobaculia bacterium]|nr:class I lanthipeptide [Thermoanaerobaculia bacterium]